MELTVKNTFKNLVIIGDRLLIRIKKAPDKTASGLYLPPGVQEKEMVQTGYVLKVGPGYPIPMAGEEHEPWKENPETVKYIPLQVKEGDLAIFLQKGAVEVIYEGEKLFIVPQSSVLMLEREEEF